MTLLNRLRRALIGDLVSRMVADEIARQGRSEPVVSVQLDLDDRELRHVVQSQADHNLDMALRRAVAQVKAQRPWLLGGSVGGR